jgi:hypothetical protein
MKTATNLAIIGTFGLVFSHVFYHFINTFRDHSDIKYLMVLLKFIIFFQLFGYISILNFFIQFKKNIIEKDEVLEIGKK